MGRNFKPKKPSRDSEKLRKALAAVASGSSVHEAARTFGIPRTTLRRHVTKNADLLEGNDGPEAQVQPQDFEILQRGFTTVSSHFFGISDDAWQTVQIFIRSNMNFQLMVWMIF